MNTQINATTNEYMNTIAANVGASNKKIAEELSRTFMKALRDNILPETACQVECLLNPLDDVQGGRATFQDFIACADDSIDEVENIAAAFTEWVQTEVESMRAAVAEMITSVKVSEDAVA